MRWAIQGYYGVGNLGDDLMLYLLQEQIMTFDPEATFSVIHSFRGESGRIVSPSGARGSAVSNAKLIQVVREIIRSDIVLFGGGTCLHNHGTCGLRVNMIARALRKPVYWVGIGADRIDRPRSRRAARLSLNSCSGIAVRDRESADAIRELAGQVPQITVADDLVYLLPASPTLAQEQNAGGRVSSLLIGWREYREMDGISNQELANNVAASALAVAIELGLTRVNVLPIADVIDDVACTRLAETIAVAANSTGVSIEVRKLEGLDLYGKLAAIRNATIFLSGRLHGVLVAKLFDVPTVAVRYARKVDRFLAGLGSDSGLTFESMKQPDLITMALMRESNAPSLFREDPQVRAQRARLNIQMLMSA
jgi:polysaccharide pyruvyl transferase WcaK-like protein